MLVSFPRILFVGLGWLGLYAFLFCFVLFCVCFRFGFVFGCCFGLVVGFVVRHDFDIRKYHVPILCL